MRQKYKRQTPSRSPVGSTGYLATLPNETKTTLHALLQLSAGQVDSFTHTTCRLIFLFFGSFLNQSFIVQFQPYICRSAVAQPNAFNQRHFVALLTLTARAQLTSFFSAGKNAHTNVAQSRPIIPFAPAPGISNHLQDALEAPPTHETRASKQRNKQAATHHNHDMQAAQKGPKACTTCAKAKARCIPGSADGDKCER